MYLLSHYPNTLKPHGLDPGVDYLGLVIVQPSGRQSFDGYALPLIIANRGCSLENYLGTIVYVHANQTIYVERFLFGTSTLEFIFNLCQISA